MRKTKFYFALSENHYKSIKEFMCAALSCSLETRFMPSTGTTQPTESTSLAKPPRIVRKSLLADFTLSNSSSSSSSSSKDIKKENLSSPLKRARTMKEDEAGFLSEEDRKKVMAKQNILQQFKDLLQNSPRMIDGRRIVLELTRWRSADPSAFAKFNTHANLLMAGRCRGRYAEHGYLASEHTLAMKQPFYHANHVAKDIAAEAPNSATAEIFWEMVFQHEMDSVVMLTQFGPGQGYNYCEGNFGSFKVQCMPPTTLYSENGIPLIIRRTLEIQRQTEVVVKKEIRHIQVANWLDDEALPTLTFKALLDITRHYGKLVAHCIAGLGRTGTFLAARMVYPRIRTENLETVIPACANSVREARPGSIRDPKQFESIYDVMKSIKENHVTKPEEEKSESKK